MSKPTGITVTYKPNADEVLQVSITIGQVGYPDQLREIKATAVGALSEILTDVLSHKELTAE